MFKDNLKYGIILGIIGPIIALICFYFWKFGVYPFKEFMQFLFTQRKILVAAITFSLIANAITFTVFINKEKDHTAKGIFLVTMVWAIVILVLKFF